MLSRLFYSILLFLFTSWLPAQETKENPLPEPKAIRGEIEEWVETMRILSAEQADWKTEKQSLSALNEVRKRETLELAEFAKAAGDRVDEVAKKREAFQKEESDLKKFRREVDTRISAMENRLRPQLARFPVPLRHKVEEAILRVESPEANTPLQNRVRDVLLILQAYIDFQSEIHVEGDLREIDGQQRQIDVIYLGMARGFYVDKTNRYAGVGTPGSDGWTWTENNRLANEIRSAIDIRSREAAPVFVKLPLGPANEASE